MKRYIALILIPINILHLTGCHTQKIITREQFMSEHRGDIKIITYEDKSYELKEDQYKIRNDTLYLINGPIYFYNYNEQFINLENIKNYEVQGLEVIDTIFAGLGVFVVVAIILTSVMVIKLSKA